MKTKSLLGDLDKDGKMSGYEQARQDAIEKNMRNSKRNGGSLLDDDMNRMGYAEGNMVGPEELDYIDFGAKDRYVNEEIYTGIRSMGRHINKFQKTFKNDPDRLVNYVKDSFKNVQKNSKYQGTINRDTFYNTLEKELSKYNVDLPLQENRESFALGAIARAASKGVKSLFKQGKSQEVKDLEKFLQDDKYGDLTMSFTKKELDDEFKLSNNDPAYLEYLREAAGIKANDYEYIIKAKAMGLSDEEIKALLKKSDKEIKKQLNIREQKAEGGDIDAMLVISEPIEEQDDLVPDEEMEEDYLDFILDEALTEEEEEMLNDKLEQDEQLALLFDKVIDVAQEFAGAGLVEGPGNGISDSIPARLSDGEFVFTAKAVEEIGADELMRMMKDAEMRADERQGLNNGGPLGEEEERVVMPVDSESVKQDIRVRKETVGQPSSRKEEEDLVEDLRARRMMSGKSSVVS